jgi:hypothetical protein
LKITREWENKFQIGTKKNRLLGHARIGFLYKSTRFNRTLLTRTNIALSCMSCNASKGAKDLRVWLASNYCQSKGIDRSTVADIVKVALSEIEKAA